MSRCSRKSHSVIDFIACQHWFATPLLNRGFRPRILKSYSFPPTLGRMSPHHIHPVPKRLELCASLKYPRLRGTYIFLKLGDDWHLPMLNWYLREPSDGR